MQADALTWARCWIGSRIASAFGDRERGQTTTEYASMLGVLAIALSIALLFLRDVIRELFSDAASSVSQAPN